MDRIIFFAPLILISLGIPLVIGLLIYFVLKNLGYPNTAKYLTIAFACIVISVATYIVFEDELFTKNDARELVEEQNLRLQDEFDLIKNESVGFTDYYHTFTLTISEKDKQEAIREIKNAKDFQAGKDMPDDYWTLNDRYFGAKTIWNYETPHSFVRAYFEPSGREGYAPTYRRISISKKTNELIFEDVEE